EEGVGAVHILNGGEIVGFNFVYVGAHTASSNGTLVVSGEGSRIATAGTNNSISVGRAGQGALTVADGAKAETLLLEIAQSGHGVATISGPDTEVVVSSDGGLFSGASSFEAGLLRVARAAGSDGAL